MSTRRLLLCGLVAVLHLGDRGSCLASPTTGTFLDRPASDVRVVTFNVNWDSIFSRVNPTRADGFSRLAAAIAPDVWAFQELTGFGSTALELKTLLDAIQPVQNGWNVFKSGELAIASRWPIASKTAAITPAGEKPVMAASVDLPDTDFPVDLYLINAHYRCCGGTVNDPLRQRDSDAVVSWMRDARAPGGSIALPYATPMIVLGDLNLVGGPQPLSTLVTGNIQDNARYGTDSAPDWDGGANAVLEATHNGVAGGDAYTWRNDRDVFAPSRLDFMVYTDSVLSPTRGFVMNTAAMTESELTATGLRPFDALYDGISNNYDHLPVVMDFQLRVAPSLAIRVDVAAEAKTQSEAGYTAIPLAPSLTKTGAGTLVLDATNTFTGSTAIVGGVLAITSQSALGRSQLIEVAAAASFDVVGVPGGYALSAGQTLAGSGTVRGSITFGPGATLSPGMLTTNAEAGTLATDGLFGTLQPLIVPEPGPLGLLATASGCLLLGKRRFRRRPRGVVTTEFATDRPTPANIQKEIIEDRKKQELALAK